MRRWLWLILALLIASARGGERDPFRVLPDPCAVPFQAWRLHATVLGSADNAVAIVAAPPGWRRLHKGDSPWPGWQVSEIAERRVYFQSQARCPSVVLESAPKGGGNDRKEPDSLRISVERFGAGGGG
ncbi:DUF2531 family protein [Erwinia sp. CPCC 100877]|nr:DUF2531 family protein [Erwinia sp. CPCC 100877]